MTIERKNHMTKESIERINELARKSKTVGLTEEEKAARTARAGKSCGDSMTWHPGFPLLWKNGILKGIRIFSRRQ